MMISIDNSTFRPLRLKPISPAKTSSVTNEPPLPSPPVSSQYTNGYHSSKNSLEEPQTTVIQNGLSDHHSADEIDNDDGQWSDWEHNADPFESSVDYSHELPTSPPPPPPEEKLKPTISSLPLKSPKLNNVSKSKWDPNAPLGSEYEIPPVVITKKKATKVETPVTQDSDDFFKDMTPKVETIELMRQLETMFNVNNDQPQEQIKSTIATPSVSNKFGIMSHDHDDKQETESGNNNWDE
jgi:hypothetical protein